MSYKITFFFKIFTCRAYGTYLDYNETSTITRHRVRDLSLEILLFRKSTIQRISFFQDKNCCALISRSQHLITVSNKRKLSCIYIVPIRCFSFIVSEIETTVDSCHNHTITTSHCTFLDDVEARVIHAASFDDGSPQILRKKAFGWNL